MKRSLAVLSLFFGACSQGGFPDDFAFGAAVAGFQVEMGCPTLPAAECEDRNSDWYQFITSTVAISRSGNHLAGDLPSQGPGFYELYEADLDRLKDAGLDSFRFSFEWSRIFPQSTVGVNDHEGLRALASPAGLAWYRRLLDAMKARGIKPLATLIHYTLPTWIHDGVACNTNLSSCQRRGWLDPQTIDEAAKYAGFVAREFGGDIDAWATQNEPFAVLLPGYIQPTATRTNPPARQLALNEAKIVLYAMIRAHARMYDAIKANDATAQVGLVYNVTPIHPRDPSRALDVRAAKNVDHLFNGIFLDAIATGVLDDDLDGKGEPDSTLVNRLDYLGVNYYTRVILTGIEDSLFPDFSPLATFDILTLEQGAVYPAGIHEVLVKMRDEYPGLPLTITETGADVTTYPNSEQYLVEHLQWVKRAIDDQAPVNGFYYWSLIDNYEWNHGMNLKFGMWAVDPADPAKSRVARPIVDAYRQITADRKIPDNLSSKYPIPARD